MNTRTEQINQAKLIREMAARFNTSELRMIAMDLGVDVENLSWDNKPRLAYELSEFARRNMIMEKFLQVLHRNNPAFRLNGSVADFVAMEEPPQRVEEDWQQRQREAQRERNEVLNTLALSNVEPGLKRALIYIIERL